MDDFEDYMSEEEKKLLAKQEKCKHEEIILSCKCKCCGKWWSLREEIKRV